MGTKQHGPHDRFGDQLRLLLLYPRSDIVPDVAVRPSIKSTILYGGEVIRWQVVTKSIALIHAGVQRTGARVQRDAHRVAQAGRIQPRILPIGVADRNSRAP